MTAVNVPVVKANRRAMIVPNTPKYSPNSDRENKKKKCICYSYTMVTKDLSRKTTRSPRAQPEGEVWFSVINPWLPWYKRYISSA